jgi:hypothetical protein
MCSPDPSRGPVVSALQFFDELAVSDPGLVARLSKITQNEIGLEPLGRLALADVASITRPGIVFGLLCKADANRIQMYVTGKLRGVTVGLHENRLVPALEHRCPDRLRLTLK